MSPISFANAAAEAGQRSQDAHEKSLKENDHVCAPAREAYIAGLFYGIKDVLKMAGLEPTTTITFGEGGKLALYSPSRRTAVDEIRVERILPTEPGQTIFWLKAEADRWGMVIRIRNKLFSQPLMIDGKEMRIDRGQTRLSDQDEQALFGWLNERLEPSTQKSETLPPVPKTP